MSKLMGKVLRWEYGQMDGKVIFLNSRLNLAAVEIAEGRVIVIEIPPDVTLINGETLSGLRGAYGETCLLRRPASESTTGTLRVRELSSPMSPAKAKLVVAPWARAAIDDEGAEAGGCSAMGGLVA